MGNALFEPILQCVSRYTATRLVVIDASGLISSCVGCMWQLPICDDDDDDE